MLEAIKTQAYVNSIILAKLRGVASTAVGYVGSANYEHRERIARRCLDAAWKAAGEGKVDEIVFNEKRFLSDDGDCLPPNQERNDKGEVVTTP